MAVIFGFDTEVLAPLISQLLGLAVVAGSLILKLPQIIKILRAGSAEGISLKGHLMELVVYNIAGSWGYAQQLDFATYGENIFVLAQLILLGMLIGFYQKKMLMAIIGTAVLCGMGAALALKLLPEDIHPLLLKSQVALACASRLPQIYENYRRRSTGQLAFLTFFLAFGGGGARLLTTTVSVPWEKGKATLMASYGLTVLLNGLIVFQILMYGGKTTKKSSPPPAKSVSAGEQAAAVNSSPQASGLSRKASGVKKRATKRED